MIKLLAFNKRQMSTKEHVVVPTIFPDKTSQVWNLPEEIINCTDIQIIWNFEAEREIIDLYSIKALLTLRVISNLIVISV
jgi:hypothetical protein